MTKNSENNDVGRLDMSSKFLRILLVIVTVILIFVGPTYVPYMLVDVLNFDYVASVATGLILLIAGLFLMLFLVRKKIVT